MTREGVTYEASRSKAFLMMHMANDPYCGVLENDDNFNNEDSRYNIEINNKLVVTAINPIKKGDELFLCYHASEK